VDFSAFQANSPVDFGAKITLGWFLFQTYTKQIY